MTREQTSHVLGVVRLLWPHSNLGGNPHDVLGLWHSFLTSYEPAEVEAAVRELAADGREHAPPVGLVVRAVALRTADCPEWDEVRAEILQAIQRYRPATGEGDPYAAPPADYWTHPLIAAFIGNSWNEWRLSRDGDGTFHAQQREAWKALAARAERGVALASVGAPRKRGLQRPDYTAALPKGRVA